jgi:hypothetical protein
MVETLLMPGCKEVVKIVLGPEVASETLSILEERINLRMEFSLQIDRSTDSSCNAQLTANT